MPNGNYIIHLIVGLIKKTLYKMGQYFPKPYKSFGRNINVKFDLFDYATKPDLKNAGTDTSNFALKSNLSSLKTEVDKLDIDKLKPVPTELSKLSNIVKNNVVKKIVYNKLVAKVNNVDTSGFVLKTKYHRDKSDIEKKKKQIIMQKLVKLKRKSLTVIMINTLLLQNLRGLQQKFLLQDLQKHI